MYDWPIWARPAQLPPATTDSGNAWRTWVFLGGRGAGKTRAGAEWLRARALGLDGAPPAMRIALVGPTQGHVRSVMIEGVSGLFAIHPPHECPKLEISRNQLVWPNGAIAQIFAADEPDNLRGPQFDAAWCDELCRWRRPDYAWDMLQLALRIGTQPQAAITTTPRGSRFLRALLADPSTVSTHARTQENAANLAPAFIAEIQRRYAGSLVGKQELDGEIIDTISTGLWRLEWINEGRVTSAPEMQRIVVALDPPITSHSGSDACGIVVAGLGIDGRAYVLSDRTIRGREPTVWAKAAIAAYHDFSADRLVAETNQGGDLVVSVLKQVDHAIPVRKVLATRGKWMRAEPVAALYAEGRVVHVGTHGDLEQQLIAFGADGLPGGRSPDRLDALVWAITDLLLTTHTTPNVRPL
jgi:phage terminase large subunit-like protein